VHTVNSPVCLLCACCLRQLTGTCSSATHAHSALNLPTDLAGAVIAAGTGMGTRTSGHAAAAGAGTGAAGSCSSCYSRTRMIYNKCIITLSLTCQHGGGSLIACHLFSSADHDQLPVSFLLLTRHMRCVLLLLLRRSRSRSRDRRRSRSRSRSPYDKSRSSHRSRRSRFEDDNDSDRCVIPFF
jgi:hypothetical protein